MANKFEKFTLSMGKTFTGSELSVEGYRFGKGSPSTYIQGGTHGGEITYPIFRKLFDYLQNNELKGSVTLVPVANPISWMQRLYFYTAGKFSMYDGKDWNWFFPGSPEGTTAQRYAHMVFSEAKKHDFVIDLHTSRWSDPFLIIDSEKYLPLAKTIGAKYTELMDLKEAAKAKGVVPLSGAIDEAGIDGYTLECGSHDSMDDETFNYCFEIVLNTLAYRGQIKHESKLTPGVYYSKLRTYNAPDTGFVEYLHGYYDEVKTGEILYKLYPSHDLSKVIEVKAQEDCLIAKHQPSHIALVGDQVVQVVVKSTIKSLADIK